MRPTHYGRRKTMANKFYYNGELVRTSENHIYTHAAININTGKCYGCSSTLKGAQANIDRMLGEYRGGIEYCQKALKALERGEKGVWTKICGRRWFDRFDKNDTPEHFNERIGIYEQKLVWINENLRVVELEMR